MDIKNLSLEDLETLKKQLEEREAEKLEEYRGQTILGFKLSLVRSKDKKNNKKYSSWKAYLCHKGKRHVVHVGKDPRNAKEKITKYLKKHPELNKIAG